MGVGTETETGWSVRTDVLHPAQRLKVARGHKDMAGEDILNAGSQTVLGEGRSVPVRAVAPAWKQGVYPGYRHLFLQRRQEKAVHAGSS